MAYNEFGESTHRTALVMKSIGLAGALEAIPTRAEYDVRGAALEGYDPGLIRFVNPELPHLPQEAFYTGGLMIGLVNAKFRREEGCILVDYPYTRSAPRIYAERDLEDKTQLFMTKEEGKELYTAAVRAAGWDEDVMKELMTAAYLAQSSLSYSIRHSKVPFRAYSDNTWLKYLHDAHNPRTR